MLIILILILLAHILGVAWPVEPLVSRVLAILFIIVAVIILVDGAGLLGGGRGLLLR